MHSFFLRFLSSTCYFAIILLLIYSSIQVFLNHKIFIFFFNFSFPFRFPHPWKSHHIDWQHFSVISPTTVFFNGFNHTADHIRSFSPLSINLHLLFAHHFSIGLFVFFIPIFYFINFTFFFVVRFLYCFSFPFWKFCL